MKRKISALLGSSTSKPRAVRSGRPVARLRMVVADIDRQSCREAPILVLSYPAVTFRAASAKHAAESQ